MRIIGIDPGLHGALAIYDGGTLESVCDMPVLDGRADGNALGKLFEEAMPDMIAIELVHSMPRQGVTSTFSLGMNFGVVLGAATALSHPLVTLRPMTWKRRMGLIGKPKEASRRLAIELWPNHAESFRLVKHEGRAEAALIARAYAFQAIHEANS